MARLRRSCVSQRSAIQASIDGLAWAVGLSFADLARYDFRLNAVGVTSLVAIFPLAALAQFGAGLACGIYTGRSRFGSFDEVGSLVRAALVTTVFLFGLNLVSDPLVLPRSVPVAGGVAALVLMAGTRYTWRLALEARRRPSDHNTVRLIVFGAGEGGAQVITGMLHDPNSPFNPVALLDDDRAKGNLRIMRVPVLGDRHQLASVAAKVDAEVLLIAIPSADAALVIELSELATAAGLEVKVLPPVRELFGGPVGLGDIRDLTPADLLGRHEIDTDLAAIAGYLTGKRVLVTGAGGSIGSELCRQIYRFGPAELMMLDRDESALHAVQLSIEGRALLESRDLILLDLRERAGIEAVFRDRRPEVVFHAAALKHLTLLESHPAEAVKTNVWATLDLLEVAADAGVDRFVNISTDKAADPCSVLGYSKRIAERLTAHCATHSFTNCLSVRFGNVLGSRGSVLTSFQAQIDKGGPVTVTHPDVTRYFMTVEEASQLVIQAGAIGGRGEALVLDMGEPVNIAEVARLLAARAPRPVALDFTGLRPGEKLNEIRLGTGEVDSRPVHQLISHVDVPGLDPCVARSIDLSAQRCGIVRDLAELSFAHTQSVGD